jgi:hypothetical protein
MLHFPLPQTSFNEVVTDFGDLLSQAPPPPSQNQAKTGSVGEFEGVAIHRLKINRNRCELPALNWSTSMRGASKIEGNSLDSSRLTPILFWSYIASFSSNAGSQRQ